MPSAPSRLSSRLLTLQLGNKCPIDIVTKLGASKHNTLAWHVQSRVLYYAFGSARSRLRRGHHTRTMSSSDLVRPDEACSRDKNYSQQSQHTGKQSYKFVEDGVHNIGCFTVRSSLHVHCCGVATTHTPCRLLTTFGRCERRIVLKVVASQHNTTMVNPTNVWRMGCTTSGALLLLRVSAATLALWGPHMHQTACLSNDVDTLMIVIAHSLSILQGQAGAL